MLKEDDTAKSNKANKKIQTIRTKATCINKFVVETVDFLNKFTTTCDTRLMEIQRKIERAEIDLMLLEEKLSSVEGLENLEKAFEDGEDSIKLSQLHEDFKQEAEENISNANPLAIEKSFKGEYPKLTNNRSSRYEEELRSFPDNQRKYIRLLKLGMPLEHVKQKVLFDSMELSFDPFELIKALERLSKQLEINTGNTIQVEDEATVRTKDHLLQSEHAKYFKMLRLGIPFESVKQKMQLDGLTELEILEKWKS